MTAAQHVLNGTYRADRHGPLPDNVRPIRSGLAVVPRGAPGAASLAQPLELLTLDDCPPELCATAREWWARLVIEQPTARIYAPTVGAHCEARALWARATVGIQAGDIMRIGNRPVPNPFHKLRDDAEKTLRVTSEMLGWASTPQSDAKPAQPPATSKLGAFLAAKKRRRDAEIAAGRRQR